MPTRVEAHGGAGLAGAVGCVALHTERVLLPTAEPSECAVGLPAVASDALAIEVHRRHHVILLASAAVPRHHGNVVATV